jgi:hypothetical protein
MLRAFLRMVSENRFRFFTRAMRISCASRRWLASGHDLRSVFRKKFVPGQKFVQQHSGGWTMTGKVPVARVEGRLPLPRTKSEG